METNLDQVLLAKLANAIEQTYPSLTRREVSTVGMNGKVKAVIGMRRSGKTSFLYQCLKDRLDSGQEKETLLYINFEDERLAGLKAENLNILIEEYFRQYPTFRKNKMVTFCFDEIQEVPGWEKFIRRLLDEEKVELLISGSSAKMLSREVATSMRGRSIETWITPFSFTEFLAYHNLTPPREVRLTSDTQRSAMLNAFDKYLSIGGFPEAQQLSLNDRIQLLQGYVDVVILRDILERHQLSNITALRSLVRQLLGNIATPFSISKIYADFRSQGISTSKESLLDYLQHLQDSFLVSTLEIYADSIRRRQVNPRKVYLADHSLATAFSITASPDTGRHLENIVACALLRSQATVNYYKTRSGYEIDFIVCDYSGQHSFIQVLASLAKQATIERELRALKEASEEIPDASLHIITINHAQKIDLGNNKTVLIQPAWQWLINISQTQEDQ